MALKPFTPASEQIDVSTLVMVVYGQPGAGKTSFGFTADDVLCLDFDRGAHRSAFRKDTVQVDTWEDVANINADDVKGRKAIAVDTVGRMLDCASDWLIANNAKNSTGAGVLSLQGYGALKGLFAEWCGRMTRFGLNIILLAHVKEEKDGDNTRWAMDIQGGSHGEVLKVADAAAYLYIDENGRRTLDFSPRSWHVGKDVANFGAVHVPDYTAEPRFCQTGVIEPYLAAMNKLSTEGKMIVDLVEAVRKQASEAATAADMNALLEDLQTMPKMAVPQARAVIGKRAQEMDNIRVDKEAKVYVDIEPEGEEVPE